MRGCKPVRKLAFERARACVSASVCERERKRLACARGRNASAGVIMSTVGQLHLGDAEGVRPLRHDAARGRPLWEPLGRHLKGSNQAPHRRRRDCPASAPASRGTRLGLHPVLHAVGAARAVPRADAREHPGDLRRARADMPRRPAPQPPPEELPPPSLAGWSRQVALAALAATARRALAALRRCGSAGQRVVRMKFAP